MSPQQRAQIQARLAKVEAERTGQPLTRPYVLTASDTPAQAFAKTVLNEIHDPVVMAQIRKDRHKPGYMAEYMRKRRAKK